MGDMGEVFRALREHGQDKRASNRESSAQVLIDRGVAYTSHNAGAHLVVTHNGVTVDFWPGTGRWIGRNGWGEGRGVFPMLKRLGV